ncbi:hypothetical protein [Halomicrobium urmianum]|uniref:hypothetical protein n=1 Tax=Halomicrobium urmianum TaxID=1586233 RepID=UPI001CD9F2B0|nr:hypothetical protein [Halomicrobium urmianum]
MDVPRALAALAAGVTAFLVVGVVVTELAASRIAFSLLVGLPAGLLAGVAVTVAVALGLGDESPERRRIARSAGGFGVAFLAVAILASTVVGTVLSLFVAGAVGIVVAAATYLRSSGSAATAATDSRE